MTAQEIKTKNIKSAINEVTNGNIDKFPANSVAIMASTVCMASVRECKQIAIQMGAKA